MYRNPREVILIYFNPVNSDVINKNKCFIHEKDYDNSISNAITSVYRSVANSGDM